MGIGIFINRAFTAFGLLLLLLQSASAWQSAPSLQIKNEENLASALIASKSSEQSRALLKAHKDLLTDNLWNILNSEVGKSIDSFDYDKCLLLCEIVKQMAEES